LIKIFEKNLSQRWGNFY